MDQRDFCWLKSFVININYVLRIKVRNQQKHVPPQQDQMEGKKWNSSIINASNLTPQASRFFAKDTAQKSVQLASLIMRSVKHSELKWIFIYICSLLYLL